MARLPEGERERRMRRVERVLRQHEHGLREAELAEMLGWQRRVVNSYLRELAEEEQAYREGRLWFPEA